jgi:hypothetical protein
MEDNERLNKTLSDLKNAQDKLNDLDREHQELMMRLEKGRKAQRRISLYLAALAVAAGGMILGSFYLIARSL